ncbi:hypothetical protein SAMN05444360_1066 [Chryseobacterium carnipullorum]|uniref:hypothetical protein n=1 Tax=Chryseobacterium carnipullorum TaxID=1124835 RepID=UPI000918C8C7|nr:hypothetical protein [Chryseobacterium carnipullorum]SHL92455.1 hypothetical protein SAMN05444360_1066 [Chryseobacterium carnipullorum]
MVNEILDIIKHIRLRPKMYFWYDNTFYSYIVYFEGFIYSINLFYKLDLEREISRWYQQRVIFKVPNMVWFAQFEHINKDLSETEKIEKFLGILEEFFESYDFKNYVLI